MHRLKVFVFIAIGYSGIQAANFRSKSVDSWFSANHPRPELLTILHHKDTVIRQATNDAIGTIDNQLSAGLLQIL